MLVIATVANDDMADLIKEFIDNFYFDENAKGNVKFIMMIDSLKREENKKDQTILPTEIKEKEE